jgi:hypothetical protein
MTAFQNPQFILLRAMMMTLTNLLFSRDAEAFCFCAIAICEDAILLLASN